MTVTLETLRETLTAICARLGLSPAQAEPIIDDYLEAELRGIRTHGVFKFLALPAAVRNRIGEPTIVRETPVAALVDGNRELGPLAARFCIEIAIRKAVQSGIGLVGLRNAGRYGCLAPYGRRMAEAGMVGFVANIGGPFVAAPGSAVPRLGINPLCFAAPMAGRPPLVMDFSTTHGVWSEVLLAELEGRPLPPDTFMDREGRYTTEPAHAFSLQGYGGPKGFALCLALEILCGALIGAAMGGAKRDEFSGGFVFLALSPGLLRDDPANFAVEVATLAEEILASPPLDPARPIRLPGQRGDMALAESLAAGGVALHPTLWARLCDLARS